MWVYVHIHRMATKNIAITEEAYNLMLRHKRPNESFTELIKERFKKGKTLFDCAGAWEDMPEDEWKLFERRVNDARKNLNASLKKRIEALR